MKKVGRAPKGSWKGIVGLGSEQAFLKKVEVLDLNSFICKVANLQSLHDPVLSVLYWVGFSVRLFIQLSEQELHSDHSGFFCSGAHVILVSQSTSTSWMSGLQWLFPQSTVSEVTNVIVFLPTPHIAEQFDSDILISFAKKDGIWLTILLADYFF